MTLDELDPSKLNLEHTVSLSFFVHINVFRVEICCSSVDCYQKSNSFLERNTLTKKMRRWCVYVYPLTATTDCELMFFHYHFGLVIILLIHNSLIAVKDVCNKLAESP